MSVSENCKRVILRIISTLVKKRNLSQFPTLQVSEDYLESLPKFLFWTAFCDFYWEISGDVSVTPVFC